MSEERHINCCQKVLLSSCSLLGMSELQAEKIGAYFGGGMMKDHVCGAVTGMLLVLGAMTDFSEKHRERALKFMEDFESAHGSLLCSQLNINNFEYCDNYIKWAIDKLRSVRRG